jgi:hypothetical protein
MKKAVKRRVKVRRKWVINPRTRVVKSKKAYDRNKEKEKLAGLYENEREGLET